jgi:anti-sigma B factor antagonist
MSQIPTNSDLISSARQEAEAVLVSVRGEIDLHNSPELLVLNLAQVPYMDSSAIAVLVESLQKLRKAGGKIYLTNLQPRVKGLLEIARLDAIFVIVPEEKDALGK